MANKKIIQSRLGEREIDMGKTIHFPKGLIGFEEEREFALLQIKEDAPFLILQSLEKPTLGLLVADPYSFLADYTIRIGDAEQKLIGANSVEEVVVLVTVSIPLGKPEQTALNLTGPIVINFASRLGLQVPQADDQGKVFVHTAAAQPATSEDEKKQKAVSAVKKAASPQDMQQKTKIRKKKM